MVLKFIFLFAGLSGFLGVALGAFGAHGLRGKLDASAMHAYETAVSYQLFHTLALLVCLLLTIQLGKYWAFTYASFAFTIGILLFSGSLYLLTVFGLKVLGPVTPLGGIFLLAGWILLSLGIWQKFQP